MLSRICGFCSGLKEGGGGAGDEDEGTEPAVERYKGKFEASFSFSLFPSPPPPRLCLIHLSQAVSRAGVSAAAALTQGHLFYNPHQLLPGSGVGLWSASVLL